MGALVEHMHHQRDQLVAADVTATCDPAEAVTNRPCVLVAPPSIDYTTREVSHRIVALSSHAAGTLAAVEQLDQLVAAVELVLHVERAEPIGYPMGDAGLVPAYLIRTTTTH